MNFTQWAAQGREISVGPYQVFAREQGEGPAVLFLHGFPTSSLDWQPVIAALARRFRCITLDFLGFGASSKPVIEYSYSLQLEAVDAVVRAFALTETFVVAHDYGTTVAQELLARAREGRAGPKLRGVVFANGAIAPALHRPIAIQRLLRTRLGRALAPVLIRRRVFERSLRKLLLRPERVDFAAHWEALEHGGGARVLPRLLHYIDERKVHAGRWIDAVRRTDVPMGFVWGRGDPVSGEHVLRWIRDEFPDAPVLELEVGHYPQLEAADEVAAWLESRLGLWVAADERAG